MKKFGLLTVGGLFAVIVLSAFYFQLNQIRSGTDEMVAAVFFRDSVTELSLKDQYGRAESGRRNSDKVKVLIVPGHDKDSWGTQFNGLKELELNLQLSNSLYELLRKEAGFEVRISQTQSGYDPELLSYFENNREAVQKFVAEQKGEMEGLIATGRIERRVGVIHNTAPSETALKLYGINKWANENGVDVIVHVHFNDYPGRPRTSPGKYSGFAVYVPDGQYSNAKGSKAIGEAIQKRLSHIYPQSNLPIEGGNEESEFLVEDQELIALGSNNTLDAAAVLVEYGYIYEPAFTDPNLRAVILSDLARQTYLGLMDFFKDNVNRSRPETVLLPHTWESDLDKGDEGSIDVAKLQAALVLQGLYPPAGKSRNDCGITGYFGNCTAEAVKDFQEKYNIKPAEGFVGELTRAKLNEIY